MSDEAAIVHIDGAARGNPGLAAWAYVIAQPGRPPLEVSERLGKATNNVAEYTALVRMLQKAAELGIKRLIVHSDSELLVKQMNGEYRVKNADLRGYYDSAQSLLRHFTDVEIRHVRRDQNQRADELCNEALDGPRPASGSARSTRQAKTGPLTDERVRDEVLTCLQAAAQAWANGNPASPPVEQVWEQIWSILEDSHLLKKRSGQ